MSEQLKDKLSTSVGQAKGLLRSKSDNPVSDKSSATKSAASKSESKSASAKPPALAATGGVPESHNTLFPERIWPD